MSFRSFFIATNYKIASALPLIKKVPFRISLHSNAKLLSTISNSTPKFDEKKRPQHENKTEGKSENRAIYGLLGVLAAVVIVVDLKELIESLRRAKRNVLIDTAFAECQVTDIKQINHDTKFYRVRARNGGESSMPLPYHVLIKDDSCQVARSYSPVTITDNLELSFVIKHYPDGVMSNMLNQVKVGESILISGPVCSMVVPYKENSVEEVGMVAGGTGITPMYQLIKSILLSKTDKTKVSLFYLNKTQADILLQKELDFFAKSYPERFRVVYSLDKVKAGTTNDARFVIGGPTEKSLDYILPGPSSDCCILVCGPDGLVGHVAGAKGTKNDMDQGKFGGLLQKLGYSEKQVYKL